MQTKNIIVFGGDGYCGWPTSLKLSADGYNVTIVDNFARREADKELECSSLTPIQSMRDRLIAWKEATGLTISFELLDVAKDYDRLLSVLNEIKPISVIHFAEQRAAPYSMKSSWHKRYTVNNNINATNNILAGIVDSALDIHLIHLGTMGVYGYGTAGMEIPEGYLTVKVEVDGADREIDILYPPHPGSIYHMTKTQDALMFYYYNKNDSIRITDLHQGIVWGTATTETSLDDRLINRFDYDGDYGTVLNRFIIQASAGHPLTVHGNGGQTRAFIHIKDSIKCILLALKNPPEQDERVKIFNQMTETHTLLELAQKVKDMTGAQIRYYKNPREEQPKNTLRVSNNNFIKLGLNPIKLNVGLIEELIAVATRYKTRCDKSKIICKSPWRKDLEVDTEGAIQPFS